MTAAGPIPAPLFEHLAEVRAEIAAASHLLLGLDFDGTLAPIVPLPQNAQMPAATQTVLEALAARSDITLAIVSGRSLADLSGRIRVPAILAGNHGLEIEGLGYSFRHPHAIGLQQGILRICEDLTLRLRDIPGSLVEDKGLTASIHFRNVDAADVNLLKSLVATATAPFTAQFTLREGKKILEILPRVAWNKGAAMRWILTRLREQRQLLSVAACYIGDDETDEDVFRTSDTLGIRVGSPSCTAARFNVADPPAVCDFLRWLRAGM